MSDPYMDRFGPRVRRPWQERPARRPLMVAMPRNIHADMVVETAEEPRDPEKNMSGENTDPFGNLKTNKG